MENIIKTVLFLLRLLKNNKALCFTSFLFILSYSVRSSEPFKEELELKDASVKNGQAHYMIHCQKCHTIGESGLNSGMYLSPGFVQAFQVRHGLGVMPAFNKEEISRQDLQNILKYLKTLKHNH